MRVAKRHVNEAGADEEGETPRRRSTRRAPFGPRS
jgi:hypothetical protein